MNNIFTEQDDEHDDQFPHVPDDVLEKFGRDARRWLRLNLAREEQGLDFVPFPSDPNLTNGTKGIQRHQEKVLETCSMLYKFQFLDTVGIAILLEISQTNAAHLIKKMRARGYIKTHPIGEFVLHFLTDSGVSLAQTAGCEIIRYEGCPSSIRTYQVKERLAFTRVLPHFKAWAESEYVVDDYEIVDTAFTSRMKGQACQPDLTIRVFFEKDGKKYLTNVAVELELSGKSDRELDMKMIGLQKAPEIHQVLFYSVIPAYNSAIKKRMETGVLQWTRYNGRWAIDHEKPIVKLTRFLEPQIFILGRYNRLPGIES